MANITRWEPFRELLDMRRDWDRLFDDNFFHPVWVENGNRAPLVDVYQTADEVHVKAAMPGVNAEDVDIQVHGDLLTVKADKADAEVKDGILHVTLPKAEEAKPKVITVKATK